ncbi:N-acylneuraminate cytidylyltransferase [Arcicella rosea]|uniref:acylneuraminate cytidylyltransferase family protein n=1 Tax=Arcicella rosea TaxID=502909 RepID=UPI00345DDD46
MENKVSFFLPTRKGSERVINKNTRDFAGVSGGILRVKLEQLLQVEEVEDIIVSTNDSETINVANSFKSDKIKIIERPEHLCLSSTNIEDFINYIPSIIETEHIFWVHATAPFVTADDYADALIQYWDILKKGEFDSLISVTKIQQFLWDAETKSFINHDRSVLKWPRTQDLKPIYEINHAFYINSKANYVKNSDRIGVNPDLFVLDKVKSFDIDWEDDFKIAEIMYEKYYGL